MTSGTAHHWPARSLSDHHRERLLFQRYRATRDRATRELIVERHIGLAAAVAARYSRTGVARDDRMQLACLGLLKAIDRFDPDRAVAFSSFAVPTMVGEIRRHLRDRTWTVRPPRELQERVLRLDRERDALAGTLDRAPTGQELARATGCSLEDVMDMLQAARARRGESLDQPAGPEADGTVADTIGAEDGRYEQVEDAALVDDLLSTLPPRDRRIVQLRFQYDLTQSEIGALVGISQTQVSRILSSALERLSATADERGGLCAAA
jgi:RNA polymerase sigma-B factor